MTFDSYTRDSVGQLSREQVADHLLNTGLWPLLKQRPFNKIADPVTDADQSYSNPASHRDAGSPLNEGAKHSRKIT